MKLFGKLLRLAPKLLMLTSLPFALASETTIHPANKKVVLDGFGDDWRDLEGAPKLEPFKGAQLQLSHDHKHLLILASVPNPSHQPLPHDRMVIEIHWEKGGKSLAPYLHWEVGLNQQGKVDGENSVQIPAAVRHDLINGRTTYECAAPLSALPWNYKELSINLQLWDDSSVESPVAEWVKLPFRMNEFTKSQEAAGRILSETDFENLTPVQAHELLTKTIPSIGNTRSGASAFQRALSRTDYSGVDKAKALARFLHMNPENPSAHSLILSLFRSRLGSLGWEKSLNVVKAVSQSAKVPREQVYDGIRGHYGTKPDLIVQGWQVVGPFPFEEGINQRFTKLPPDQRTITLKEKYSVDGKKLSWKPVELTKNRCDIRKSLSTEEHGKAFAVTWVNSGKSQTAALEFKANSPAKLWINGQHIRIPTQSRDEVPIQLNQGWNQILVETDSVTTGKQSGSGTWEFQMLLLHPLGMGKVPAMSMFGQ